MYRFLGFGLMLFVFSCGAFGQEITVFDFKGQCTEFIPPEDVQEYVRRERIFRVYSPESATAKVREPYATATKVLEFFQAELDWSSWGGGGEPLFLYTNLALGEDGRCTGMQAAFLAQIDPATQEPTLGVMLVGLGDPESSMHAAVDVEVIAHEIGHGMVGSTRMGKIPTSESIQAQEGALNEAIADWIGVSFKAWSLNGSTFEGVSTTDDLYLIGASLARLTSGADGVRNLKNPYSLGDPGHIRDITEVEEHTLAGVPNLALYLIVEGGSHPRYNQARVQGIGLEKKSTHSSLLT